MKQKTLYDILNKEPFKFTLREIEEIMDEELSKVPEEMDTELIDLCADVLNRAYAEENNSSNTEKPKSKKIKARKVFLIAAILIIVLSLSLSASAKFFNIDASEKVVRFFNNHFNINLGNSNTDNYTVNGLKLINDLEEKGFENIVLPDALISEDYSTKITTRSLEDVEQAIIEFKNNSINIQGNISITKHTNYDDNFAVGQISMSDSFNQVKQISASGMNVLILDNDNKSVIYYIDKNIEYYITINCDFESAIEIAETIKRGAKQ